VIGLLENCAASSHQVSGFKVSGLGVRNRKSGAKLGTWYLILGLSREALSCYLSLDTCHFGLATTTLSDRNDGQQSFSAAD
jgi:hypothetical protein